MKKVDHRTKVTKMLIKKAFTDLLKFKPVQSITVKELCEKAGINRGTFYAHYNDVYDLFNNIEKEMIEKFNETLEPLLTLDEDEATPLKITTKIFEWIRDNADVCAVTLGPFGDKEFAGKLINIGRDKYVQTYLKVFKTATPKQLEYYYAFVSSGCIGLLEKWFKDGMTSSAEEIAFMAQNIMMYGIGFLKGDLNK